MNFFMHTPQFSLAGMHLFCNNHFGILIYLTLKWDIADSLITKPLTELFLFYFLALLLIYPKQVQLSGRLVVICTLNAGTLHRPEQCYKATNICMQWGKKIQDEIFIGCCLLTVEPRDNGLTFKHLGRGDPKGILPQL